MDKIFAVFSLALLLQHVACSDSEKAASSDSVKIASARPKPMEDIFQPFRLDPLETKEGSYIPEVSKLICAG